ncbi:hypothetical protein M434DRAFT_37359 [Hypoxylon sp. CO27-5]|nr:hypothetical protein M434DRAFT_37359 [Hypoxylon sp. CO27-5]
MNPYNNSRSSLFIFALLFLILLWFFCGSSSDAFASVAQWGWIKEKSIRPKVRTNTSESTEYVPLELREGIQIPTVTDEVSIFMQYLRE